MADFQPSKLEQILSFYIENEFSVLEAARKIEQEFNNPLLISKDGRISEIPKSGIEGAYNDIMEFSETFKAHISKIPTCDGVPTTVEKLRIDLIREEILETLAAIEDGNLIEIADGIADSIVVLIGTAIAYGIPLPSIWRAVHASNMAKANADGSVSYREDGKVLKPLDWTPPNIRQIIEDAQK